jgi:hypothetical protein
MRKRPSPPSESAIVAMGSMAGSPLLAAIRGH